MSKIKLETLTSVILDDKQKENLGGKKTIADYVLDYMLNGNQNALVPREDYDVDLDFTDMLRLIYFQKDFRPIVRG